jgi:hypothetical protein
LAEKRRIITADARSRNVIRTLGRVGFSPPEPRRGGHISAQGKRSVALGRGSHRWKARPANRGTGFFYFDTTTPQGVIDMASQKC